MLLVVWLLKSELPSLFFLLLCSLSYCSLPSDYLSGRLSVANTHQRKHDMVTMQTHMWTDRHRSTVEVSAVIHHWVTENYDTTERMRKWERREERPVVQTCSHHCMCKHTLAAADSGVSVLSVTTFETPRCHKWLQIEQRVRDETEGWGWKRERGDACYNDFIWHSYSLKLLLF